MRDEIGRYERTRCETARGLGPVLAGITMTAVALVLGGCADALIYGENTNFSLASVKLNDSVAEPVSVNVGLERAVAAIAPAVKNGNEAVNMVAGFALDHEDEDGSLFDVLKIRTEFAAGEAGRKLAEDNPEAAARIMQLSFAGPDSADLDRRKAGAVAYLRAHAGAPGIARAAKRLDLADGSDAETLIGLVANSNAAGFAKIRRVVLDELPPF